MYGVLCIVLLGILYNIQYLVLVPVPGTVPPVPLPLHYTAKSKTPAWYLVL